MKEILRIWWISNPPREPFIKEVSSIGEGKKLLNLLASYDLYLGELIDCNASGMEVQKDGKWIGEEWYDDEGNDIWDTPLIDRC